MKYLFLVQGEGRGHMSQAIALSGILQKNGHNVAGVLIGKNPQRQIPDYVYDHLGSNISEYESPNFLFNDQHKGIKISKSFIYNLARSPRYFNSIGIINSLVKETKPDVIINFYDLVGGLYNFIYPGVKMICIGHQFLKFHPDFPYPKGREVEKHLMQMHNSVVSINAAKCLALSFRPMRKLDKAKNIFIVPPLLREELLQIESKSIQNHGYIHGYILNDGFAKEIIDWHKKNTDQILHFYWDKKNANKCETIHENLTFHQINDVEFLEHLKNCSMFAGTAGFESLCESMYLGKPFLCVPSYNHFEQACNALDATMEEAGIWNMHFDLDKLIEFGKKYEFDPEKFRQWVRSAPDVILEHLK